MDLIKWNRWSYKQELGNKILEKELRVVTTWVWRIGPESSHRETDGITWTWEELRAHSDLSVALELDAKVYTALGGILRMIRMGKAPAEKMSNVFLKVCVCYYTYICIYI